MISLEGVPFNSSNILEDYPSNGCNTAKTPTPIVLKEGENKVAVLEESIEYLCKQHAFVLDGLYDEIENLRRANKDLQFRLVMCCCVTKGGKEKDEAEPTTCSRTAEDLASEVIELRQQLEKERLRNKTLVHQLETLRIAHSVVSETLPKNAPSKGGKVPVNEVFTAGRLEMQTINPKKPPQKHEKRQIEGSDTSNRLSQPIHTRTETGPSILSPELNPDSSSSAILLTPKTSIKATEGFWVRPSVASLQNKLWQTEGTSPHNSHLPGTRIIPVKLPVLRTSGPMAQPVEEIPGQELLTPTLHPTEIHKEGKANVENVARRSNSESNPTKSFHSARGALGNNNTTLYDSMHNNPRSANSVAFRTSHTPYNQHLGPFLPALPKPGDPGNATRARKARELQRKRLGRAPDLFPS
ncbi:hypothetical protein CSKR_111388 [Clonorchis sinensis]|uniref:CCDC92/74 N-terminal domain-containing protein n=1 Tax=Clonorchis sinensis TaxID=79923 RepID=A0A8T1M6G7_CLOSI|nr:hypothetical protein CSKR_111388 [Clonorchis sinensis]